MGNKLKVYIKNLRELLESGKKIENPEAFKLELIREIGFWQHERFVHLIVTFLFAVLAVAFIIVMIFHASIAVFLLFLMLLVLLVPYIKHYYVLENGVQTLYVIYEEICRRYPQEGVPSACIPTEYGIKIEELK